MTENTDTTSTSWGSGPFPTRAQNRAVLTILALGNHGNVYPLTLQILGFSTWRVLSFAAGHLALVDHLSMLWENGDRCHHHGA